LTFSVINDILKQENKVYFIHTKRYESGNEA